MIGRIWHGWTTPENADPFEAFLTTEMFPRIAAMNVPGYRGIELFRRASGGEVEFLTVMRFDSLESVKQYAKKFAGEDYEHSYVPPETHRYLTRFDEYAQHYEIREKPGS